MSAEDDEKITTEFFWRSFYGEQVALQHEWDDAEKRLVLKIVNLDKEPEDAN
jgi:hypothetical protein